MMMKPVKVRILKETYDKIIKEEHAGKTFISVDIQPEYESGFTFDIYEFCEYLNEESEDFSRLIFFYNGFDTLGMIEEHDYKMYLLQNGLEEEVLDRAIFYDKGYAFFRYCMDKNVDHDEIVDLVRFMRDNDINDSRDVDEEMWIAFSHQYKYTESEIQEILEFADDAINIPDVMDFLSNENNIVLTGGGVDECLKEVEIALDALGKTYEIDHKFTY